MPAGTEEEMGGIDWFAHADQPIDDAHRELGVAPKGDDVIRAGSLSAMDPDAVFKHARWLPSVRGLLVGRFQLHQIDGERLGHEVVDHQ